MAVKIFLSTVSDEFRRYRDLLRTDLTRHNVEVKVQEDFRDLGGDTLDKLDVYIDHCDAVVHLLGDMTGAYPINRELSALLAKYSDLGKKLPPLGEALKTCVGVSYTQWEAWLALYHGKRLLIAKAGDSAERGPKYAPTDDSRFAQVQHLARLAAVNRFPGCTFTSPADLAKHIAYTAILDLLADARAEQPARQPRNLPFASLGPLFKGRDEILDRVREALTGDKDRRAIALYGLGGVGKTRLAVEYAVRHESEHSALLFVSAAAPERLDADLAGLAGLDILDLPEKGAREDEVKISACLKWLDEHPGWLMILDNVDDETAAAAVEKLIPRLKGGHILVNGRTADFSPSIETLSLNMLDETEAASLLLGSTKKREKSPDDDELARKLARELGGLPLALSQASAYIDKQRTSFARYLKLWRETRNTVLNWFDKRLVSYNHDVGLATTWAASIEKLTPQGRHLLDLCAFVEDMVISKDFFDNLEGGDEFDPHEALADLFAYSLVSDTTSIYSGPSFYLHPLVRDFTRLGMTEDRRQEAQVAALDWLDRERLRKEARPRWMGALLRPREKWP
jgi:hypothetical protein